MSYVSVIIPNYNHARFLKQRIDSVLEQTYQDFEVIILDDNSQDNSKEIIEKYRTHPKISHIIYNEINSGSTFNQWKKGLELAKGEWIWIAESDDWAENVFLQEMLTYSEKEGVKLAYCDSYYADENGEVKGLVNWGRSIEPKHWDNSFINSGKEEIINYLFCRNIIPNASAVIVKKKELYDALQSFPFQFKYAGDWYVWIKCIENGNVAFFNKPLNYFRQHKKSTRSGKSRSEEKRRFKEYFYIINDIKKKYTIDLDSKKHNWIIYEWVSKNLQENKILSALFPPLPIKYYLAYYKMQISEKVITKIIKK